MLLRIWDVTLPVSDLGKAVVFYEKVLELPLKYHFPNDYAGFDCGGVEIGLAPSVAIKADEGNICPDFLVRDIDQVFHSLSARGVRFIKEPHDTPWGGRIALFEDLDGNRLQLVQINWSQYFKVCAK